jgi:hypothetical protein
LSGLAVTFLMLPRNKDPLLPLLLPLVVALLVELLPPVNTRLMVDPERSRLRKAPTQTCTAAYVD